MSVHAAIISDYLDDQVPSLLDGTCQGCKLYACHKEAAPVDPLVGARFPIQFRTVHSCGAQSFSDCHKMSAILEQVMQKNPRVNGGMTIQEFRAQQYQTGDVLTIRTGTKHPPSIAVRVLAVLDDGNSVGVIGRSSDGRLWAADAEYILASPVRTRS